MENKTSNNVVTSEKDIQVCRCKVCGEEKFAFEMRQYAGKPTKMCKECYNASKTAKKMERRNDDGRALVKNYTNPSLASFTPRELMDELVARGYHGELYYTTKIKI